MQYFISLKKAIFDDLMQPISILILSNAKTLKHTENCAQKLISFQLKVRALCRVFEPPEDRDKVAK